MYWKALKHTEKPLNKVKNTKFAIWDMTLTFDLLTFVKVISPQCHYWRPQGSRTFGYVVKDDFASSET